MNALSIAKMIYSARDLRPGSEVEGLYSDPAWDILVDIYIHEKSAVPTSITAACAAARCPPSTALRYVTLLCNQGLLARERDPNDRRRYWLKLTPKAEKSLDQYMTSIISVLSQIVGDPKKRADPARIAQALREASRLSAVQEEVGEKEE